MEVPAKSYGRSLNFFNREFTQSLRSIVNRYYSEQYKFKIPVVTVDTVVKKSGTRISTLNWLVIRDWFVYRSAIAKINRENPALGIEHLRVGLRDPDTSSRSKKLVRTFLPYLKEIINEYWRLQDLCWPDVEVADTEYLFFD